MELTEEKKTTRSFWIISIVALVWNLIGVMTYLMTVTMSPETLAAMPEAERAIYTGTPAWVTSAYAIAVFAGTLGCILLLVRKAMAIPVFVVSLICIIVQMFYTFFMTEVLALRGATSVILPLLIVGIGIYLVSFSRSARKQGIIS